ncbi:MAG: hypothetical protein Q9188_007045 [Gyalolechia gomerana]
MMRKRGFSRKINYGVIGSAYESRGGTPRGSEEGSRRSSGSGVPEVRVSPKGEILVAGGVREGSGGAGEGRTVRGEEREGSVLEIADGEKAKGGSREEAIEVEDGEESEADDYYDEDEDMEMAGVDEVLGRLGGDDDEDDDEGGDDY